MRTYAPIRAGGSSATIAVDMGATSVRVVEMEFGAGMEGAMRVTKRGMAPLPNGLWSDLATHKGALSSAITQALASAGITGKSVVACMPRRMVTLRFVRLPHAPPDQLRGMVEFEAQQYVLFPLDDVILDYHVVSNPLDAAGVGVDDMDTVLLAAARRSLIVDIMYAFDTAGLELQQLSASALALAENGRDSLEPTALIDVEPGEIDVAVIADGQLLFSRASALDIQGINPEVAERKEVEEVVRSFTAYQNEFRNRPIAHVSVGGESGSGSVGDSLARALTDMLEMPVSPLIPRGLPSGDKEGRAWATAIGMALQSRAGSIAPISLVPNERAERKARQAKSRQQQLMALAGVAVLIVSLYFGSKALDNAKKESILAVAKNGELKTNTDLLAKLQKEHDKTKAISDNVTKGLDRNHPAVDILYALNHALPTTADIWLTQFQFDRGGILTIHGETKSAIAATQLVLALQKSGAFTDVRLGYLGDSQESKPTSTQPGTPAPPAVSSASSSAAAGTATPAAKSSAATMPVLPGSNGLIVGGSVSGGAVSGMTGSAGGAGTTSGTTRINPQGRRPIVITPGNSGGPTVSPAPISASPAAPPVIITPDRPAGSPSSKATPAGASRGASAEASNGKLILVGWGGQDPQNPNPSGNPNGNPRRNRRPRDANGNIIPNPGSYVQPGTAAPGTPGAPAAPPAPYTSGSIFGATTPTPSPPIFIPLGPGTGGGNPNDPGYWQRRRFNGGVGGGAASVNPVPSTSPPSGGIQRSPVRPVIKIVPKRATSTKQTLTSFVITCRVNALRKDLIPQGTTAPVQAATDNSAMKKKSKNTRKATSTDTTAQDGSDDAESQ